MKRHAIAASLAMLLSTSAFATATADVQFRKVKFTLVDLAPDDGVAPSLTFMGSSGSAMAPKLTEYITIGDYNDMNALPNTSANNELHLNPYHSYGEGTVRGDIDITDRATPTGAFLSFGSSATGSSTTGPRGVSYTIAADAGWTGFTLSANTGVRFSVVSDVRLTTDPDTPGAGAEFAAATQWIAVDSGGTLLQDRHSFDSGAPSNGSQALNQTSAVEIYFTNTNEWDAFGFFGYGGTALAQVAAPVPEPGALPMLAAGLALVGVVARRRKAA